MKMIDLILKDLSQIFRDKRSLLFLIAMPLVFTFFMGFAYRGGGGGEPEDTRMPLAWVQEGTADELSQMLYARLGESDALKRLPMEQDAAFEALEKGEVDGVLMVPSGFGQGAVGNPEWQLTLVADPASNQGQSLYQLLRVPVTQLMSAVEISQISAEMLGEPTESTPALKLAWEKWGQNNSKSLVRMEKAITRESESWFGDNPYNQASPGILVQFAIMGLVTSAQILVRERQSRTLQRLMTTALKPWQILAGHMLAMFAIVFLQTALLVIFGQLVLDVAYLREPLSVLLVSIALGLWVSSMGTLIGLLAKGDDQVVLFSMIAMFFFSALGGAWFPLETSGRVFSMIGKALPSAWAMTGLQNVLIRGLGLAAAWTPVGVLLAYALGFFALAAWRFRATDI